MICPNCHRTNPEDDHFCIYCAAPLVAEEPSRPPPATGPTQVLDPPPASAAPAPAAPPPPASPPRPPRWFVQREKEFSGAVWLIGLGLLFLTNLFWPGILVLVGLSAAVHEAAQGQAGKAVRSVIFFTGMALLFWVNLFWPGILILAGVTALLSPELQLRRSRARSVRR